MPPVENTLRPVSQAYGERVPAGYALQVGEIDVLVVSDGVLPLPAAAMQNNADMQEAFGWPLNVMVARSGEQTILVDAGLGGQFEGFPRGGQFPRRLDAAGIQLESITDVVITRMHMDHVGGLLADAVKQRLSPDVRVHVAAAEVASWAVREPVPVTRPTTAARFLDMYWKQLRSFEDRFEVAPGVEVRLAGGYSPGYSVVDLHSGGMRLMFAGDAMFPVAFGNPDWQKEPAPVRRLFQELADNGGLLVAAHLAFPSMGRVAVNGDAFRWVPVFWDF